MRLIIQNVYPQVIQKCNIQSISINLHPNEYVQVLHNYPFTVNLERYVGMCNILNDSSNKVCILNKTENLNLSMFNVVTGIKKLKTLTAKHILY